MLKRDGGSVYTGRGIIDKREETVRAAVSFCCMTDMSMLCGEQCSVVKVRAGVTANELVSDAQGLRHEAQVIQPPAGLAMVTVQPFSSME